LLSAATQAIVAVGFRVSVEFGFDEVSSNFFAFK
jgi:hypothetical protein